MSYVKLIKNKKIKNKKLKKNILVTIYGSRINIYTQPISTMPFWI